MFRGASQGSEEERVEGVGHGDVGGVRGGVAWWVRHGGMWKRKAKGGRAQRLFMD